MIDQSTLNGLAFPTAVVKYSSGAYRATIKRDGQRFTGRASYDFQDRNVSRVAAVWAALDRCTAVPLDRSAYALLWGDLDSDGYVCVVVPNTIGGER